MESIAEINNRRIYFKEFGTSKNWFSDFPNRNWSLIIIADDMNTNYFDEIIRKAIDNDVIFISSIGKHQELIHDLADEELEMRDVENQYLPKHNIITTGHEDFEEGIWFGIYVAESIEKIIEQVLILDVSRNNRTKTIELIKKFELGYLPKS